MLSIPLRLAAAALLSFLVPRFAMADNELIDRAFGDDGFVLVDSTGGDSYRDEGIATCPGPGNTQVVIGGQGGTGRVTVARLLADGALDPSFGNAGKVSFDVAPAAFGGSQRALCLGNGRAVIARVTFITGTFHLFRIASDGQLDPTFSGGQVVIDPAALPGGVGGMVINGMDPAPNGEILLTGGSPLDGGMPASPFLVRLHADGSLRDSRVLSDPGFGTRSSLSTAGYGSDGSLMLLGTTRVELGGMFYARWFSVVLNGVDLSGGVEQFGEPSATKTFVTSGRMLRPGVLVAAAAFGDGSGPTGHDYRPRILVFRRGTAMDGVTLFELPAASQGMALDGHMLVATDASHMLFATGVRDAYYFSHLHIGDEPSGDGVDPLFGSSGVSIARRELVGCGAGANWYAFRRISLWNGQPVFVGSAARSCAQSTESDVLVGRLLLDRIFANGFE